MKSSMKSAFARVSSVVFLAFLAAALFSGCAFLGLARSTKFKPPAVSYAGAKVNSVEPRAAQVDFHLKAKNPNSVGIKGVKVSYELFYKGNRFLAGDDIVIDLAPNAERPLVIPTEIVYADVFATAGGVALKVAAGAKTIPVRIGVVMSGNPTLYDSTKSGTLWLPFSVKISRVQEIPVPQDQINDAKDKAKDTAIKKFKKRKF
jgi:hypothetical protein